MKLAYLILLGILVLFVYLQKDGIPLKRETNGDLVITPTVNAKLLVEPVEGFGERITKKPFGILVSDRFAGYHTGVDVEYEDVLDDVPVFAITDGVVTTAKFVSGYGGLVIIRHTIKNEILYGVYGHLRPSSLVKKGVWVKKGEKIGILGKGKSLETDGERKHLHFGLSRSESLLGYVQSEEILNKTWVDPLKFY